MHCIWQMHIILWNLMLNKKAKMYQANKYLKIQYIKVEVVQKLTCFLTISN